MASVLVLKTLMHSGMLSNRSCGTNVKVGKITILSEDGTIVNNQGAVCKVFNGFFNALADNIGQNPNGIANYHNEDDLDGYVAGVLQRYGSHSSVTIIKIIKGGFLGVILIFNRHQARITKHA